MVKTEQEADMELLADEFCERGAVISTDQLPSYFVLAGTWDHQFVNHKEEFKSKAGVHTNLAENYFVRMRACQAGALPGCDPSRPCLAPGHSPRNSFLSHITYFSSRAPVLGKRETFSVCYVLRALTLPANDWRTNLGSSFNSAAARESYLP